MPRAARRGAAHVRIPLPGRAPGRCCALLFAAALAACATPAERYDRRAAAAGFEPAVVSGNGFRHRVFAADLRDRAPVLRVYIEHDGTPWVEPTRVSNDPTPRSPVALELMARDAGPRVLLGRPCYFEPNADPGCGPLLWTHRRYSPEVIGSMVAALRALLARYSIRRVVLIGFSGGGTLAWLMARQLPETVAVVTIAANLDVDRWAELHGYSPLSGSLNPALLPPLPDGITQLHYAGGRDVNVPPAIVLAFARHHPEARVVVIAEFEHECCWSARWPQLLDPALPAASALPAVQPVAGR